MRRYAQDVPYISRKILSIKYIKVIVQVKRNGVTRSMLETSLREIRPNGH